MYRRALVSLRPEQVEEKRCAEYGGDRDADKDVVRGNSHKIVVVYDRKIVEISDEFLLIHVFYSLAAVSSNDS